MYNQSNVLNQVKLLLEVISKIPTPHTPGDKLVIELCNSIAIKMNYDIKFVSENNEKAMIKNHTQLTEDVLYLVKQRHVINRIQADHV